MSKKLDKLLMQLINLHPKYIDLSLNRLQLLLQKLGDPHLNIPPTIHIAGTNGKGSTLSFIRQILIENNLKVHSYTSPHLNKFNERIFLSNKKITTIKLLSTLNYVKKVNSNEPITFFEITTAAAFLLFSKEKADFLILETGLGGRLDATNIIKNSLINIITPIGIDHQEYLGKNILKITNEKLGIIKKNSIVIISKQKQIVLKRIKEKLKYKNNETLIYNKDFKIITKDRSKFLLKYKKEDKTFKTPNLIGEHQIENVSTAISAVLKLNELGIKFTNKTINNGILKTKWPGRLESGKLKNTKVYLDGAHNIDGAKQLLRYFRKKKYKLWLIVGMLNNKNLTDYLRIIKPILYGVIPIKIPNEKNSFTTHEISNICDQLKIKNYPKASLSLANKYLLKKIKPKLILVSGSLYLIGKVRKFYL